MRRWLLFSVMLLCAATIPIGCCRAPDRDRDVLARINDYTITRSEFEEEYRDSAFGRADTPESRRDYLNNLIDRKLILQYAEKTGLHKDRSFLRMVERFWEQSLLKSALDRKTKEITAACAVSDQEVRQRYDSMVKEGEAKKSYVEMYSQIKWELARLRESKMMSDWVDELHRKARIQVNYDSLK